MAEVVHDEDDRRAKPRGTKKEEPKWEVVSFWNGLLNLTQAFISVNSLRFTT